MTANDPSAVDLIAPGLSVAKTVNGVELVQATNGTLVTYAFVVSNGGDVTLTNVVVDDPLLSFNQNVGDLAAGQSVTVTTVAAVSADLTNLVTTTGGDPLGNPVTGTDTAVVDRINPAVSIANTANGVELATGTNGTLVTYAFVISNPGDVALTNVVVTNAVLGFGQTMGDLAVGQVVTVTVNSTISADLTNSAVVTGFDPIGGSVTANDPSAVDLISPAILVSKTVSMDGSCPGVESVSGMPGRAINYCLLVTNAGDVALNSVVLADPQLAYSTNIGVMAVGATFAVSLPANITGDLTNTASVTGLAPQGSPVGDEDTAAALALGQLLGRVRLDVDGDGVADVEDTNGLAGVTVTLFDAATNVVGTTVTDATGAYAFTNLVPGVYVLRETDEPGYLSTGDIQPPNDNTITSAVAAAGTVAGQDFFDTAYAQVSGLAWRDENLDGQRSGGEPLLSNVVVTLYDRFTNAVGVTTTDVAGAYAFTNVPPAAYLVGFTPLPGHILTTPDLGGDDVVDSDAAPLTGFTAPFVLLSGGHEQHVDSGQFPAVPGLLLIKTAGDAADGASEYILPGESVLFTYTVINTGNTWVADLTVTDSVLGVVGGSAVPLAPGDTNVFTLLAPSVSADVTNIGVAAANPVDSLGNDLPALADVADADDAVVDVVRPGYTLGKDLVDPVGRSAITGEVVTFHLTLVNTGDVALAEVPMADHFETAYLSFLSATPSPDSVLPGDLLWTNAGPVAAGASTTLVVRFVAVGETALAFQTNHVFAGPLTPSNYPPVSPTTTNVPYQIDLPAALGDFVWEDLDGNGLQDPLEPGLGGVVVTLFDALTNVVNVTTSSPAGGYLFSYLTTGQYFIGVSAPGYELTAVDAGADADDSDADPLTGRTPPVLLAAGVIADSLDAGLFQRGSLGNFVWHDVNGNGLQDSGETGLVGVAVSLYGTGGILVAATSTATDGSYVFTNLVPGAYAVEMGTLPGYAFTTRDVGVDDDVDSDSDPLTGRTGTNVLLSGVADASWDAGLFVRGSIGDFVWLDSNSDGVQDVGETGLVGVAVTLYGPQSNVVGVTTSGLGGAYAFTQVSPGSYFVGFAPQVGLAFSPAHATGDDLDSDASILGFSPLFALLSDQAVTNVDAGLYVPSAITITKSPDLQVITAGSNAFFSITVSNAGLSVLSDVNVADPAGVACARNLGTLGVGSSTTFVCTVSGVAASFTNVAVVTASDPFANVVSDTNDAVVQVIRPGLRIFKSPGLQRVTNGLSAVFTITVTNTGDVTLTNVAVRDPSAPQCDNTIPQLLPGQASSYACSVLNVTQDFVNEACVVGYDPLGQYWTDCGSAQVLVTESNRPGCTKAATFWFCYTNVWPVESLELGGDPWAKTNLLVLLKTCNPTDVTYQVAKQLAAAQLNAFNGADFSVVSQTMVDAEVWLITHPLGSNPGGADALAGQALADLLLSYNTGVIGPGACYVPVAVDFDGDYRSDLGVYWPSLGRWYVQQSSQGILTRDFGWAETIPFAADYDGDDRADSAVYHPAAGTWYVLKSDTLQMRVIPWGWSESVPVPGDYDGDGYEDLAVYHPASGNWYIRESTNKAAMRMQNWGWSQTVPVPGDYDGDAKADLAAYHPASGNWYLLLSGGGSLTVNWGWAGAQPVPADYDGDGITDLAVYAPELGTWYVRFSGGGTRVVSFGWRDASPVPADYDGDGRADISVFHRDGGVWYILPSESGAMVSRPWGWSDVVPVLPQWQINRWMNKQLRLWPVP